MRLKTIILLGLLLVTGLVIGASVRAQERPSPAAFPPERPVVLKTGGMPAWDAPLTAPQASDGAFSDNCENAIPITLSGDPPWFNTQVSTIGATSSITDPVQSCTWPDPAANSNSVWFSLSVPEDGRLHVMTTSDYDTVVTIYPAAVGCGSFSAVTEAGCDDDSRAFQAEASALVDGGHSYLIEVTGWGDANEGGNLYLYIYFTPDTHWRYLSGVALPTPLTRHVAVSDGRYLYLLGGQNTISSDALNRYDPRDHSWQPLPEMPASYANTDGAYVDGRIYIPSGFTGDSTYGGTHYSYSINEEEAWSTRAPITSTSQITEPVAWGAAAADPSDTAYYYTGGRRGSAPEIPSPYAFRYDIQLDSWQTLNSMTTPRYAHGAAFLGGDLCVVGGIGEQEQILASGECFDFGNGTWSPTADLNIPRYSFGRAVGVDGRWYVFGGVISGTTSAELTTPKTEVYDFETDTWTLLDQRSSLHQSRAWPAGALVGLDIYAVGGYLNQQGTVVNTMEWLNTGPKVGFLPLLVNGSGDTQADLHEPNDAIPLAFGPLPSGTLLVSDLSRASDRDDFFYISAGQTVNIQITLSDIPKQASYDLYLYGYDKSELASSTELANLDEHISVDSVPAGAYYIRVHKAVSSIPSSGSYSLQVNFDPTLAKTW